LIQELLAVAREYAIDGFWALQDAGMSYVNTPIALGKDEVQKVKLSKEILETLSGSCIDGAVLFA